MKAIRPKLAPQFYHRKAPLARVLQDVGCPKIKPSTHLKLAKIDLHGPLSARICNVAATLCQLRESKYHCPDGDPASNATVSHPISRDYCVLNSSAGRPAAARDGQPRCRSRAPPPPSIPPPPSPNSPSSSRIRKKRHGHGPLRAHRACRIEKDLLRPPAGHKNLPGHPRPEPGLTTSKWDPTAPPPTRPPIVPPSRSWSPL